MQAGIYLGRETAKLVAIEALPRAVGWDLRSPDPHSIGRSISKEKICEWKQAHPLGLFPVYGISAQRWQWFDLQKGVGGIALARSGAQG
jgi:hypothetical protein